MNDTMHTSLDRRPVALVALVLGLGALGLAACVILPGLLTSPQVRALYPLSVLVTATRALAIASLAAAALSALRERAAGSPPGLGLWGGLAGLVAWAASTVGAPLVPATDGLGFVGLDWLVLDALVFALVLIPLERLWPRRAVGLARPGWRTDLGYFVVNHLAIHGLGLIGAAAAHASVGWLHAETSASGMAAWPLPVQIVVMLFVADLVQYALHRAMHEVPILWRFHAVHHASEHMDALAGSRIHLAETLVTRSAIFATFHALGFPFEAFLGYAAIIAVQGSFIHANVRLDYGWLEHVVVSPRYHHWHHASDAEAIDTNYAGTFPIIDRLFGTWRLPAGRWPVRYGVVKEVIPETLLGQQAFPFRSDVRASGTPRDPASA
ncbi:MAG: sterol desaturase family protein [Deltaproteobacteria bacterium]|nr:sterol desaturase family protein [Deltaproteobacteria bacterium]